MTGRARKMARAILMPPRSARLLLLPALAVLLAVCPPRIGAQTATGGDQLFAVHLQIAPSGGQPNGSCPGDEQTRLQQLVLQFHLMMNGSSPMLGIAPSELSAPAAATDATVPLQSDASGLSFTNARIHLDIDQITLGDAEMHLTSPQGSAPAGLVVDHVSVSVQTVTGDVVTSCAIDATGSGQLDTTPPVAFFTDPCSDSAPAGCVLLADGAVTIAFSKPVVLADVSKVLTVADDAGNAVPLFPAMPADPTGYKIAVHGAWPLGRTLTFRLAAGVHDLAGNAYNAGTPPLLYTVPVVADPGDLDAAGNSGFEAGDLSGYSALSQPNQENLLAVYDPSAYAFTPAPAPNVVSDFDGITPTEGSAMFSAGSLTGDCDDQGIVVLTARFSVPEGVSTLVLDDAAVTAGPGSDPRTYPGQGPILSASVRGAGTIAAAMQYWKDVDSLSSADDGNPQTGWKQASVDVSGFVGQTVVLTLRLFTQTLTAPLFPCHTSVILVDNLRFE